MEEADVILFNTCSVRENPERQVYGQVGLLKELKNRARTVIGICGCMPQSREERQPFVERLPHVDLSSGRKTSTACPTSFQQVEETGRQVVEVWDEDGDIVEGLPVAAGR